MTETFLSSTLQIPTFWAANTIPIDKLWKRERENQSRDIIYQPVDWAVRC